MTASIEDIQSEIKGIQQQVFIASLGRAGVRRGGTIECIRETLAETKAWPIGERFGMFAGSAAAEKEKAIQSITKLLNDAENAAGLPLTTYTAAPEVAAKTAPVERQRTSPVTDIKAKLTELLTALHEAIPPAHDGVSHNICLRRTNAKGGDSEMSLALQLNVTAIYYQLVYLEEGDLEKPAEQLVAEIMALRP